MTLTKNHRCAARGCKRRVPIKMLMCRAHWYTVPKPIRDRVWATYRPGQEAVAQKEGRVTDG